MNTPDEPDIRTHSCDLEGVADPALIHRLLREFVDYLAPRKHNAYARLLHSGEKTPAFNCAGMAADDAPTTFCIVASDSLTTTVRGLSACACVFTDHYPYLWLLEITTRAPSLSTAHLTSSQISSSTQQAFIVAFRRSLHFDPQSSLPRTQRTKEELAKAL